MLYVASVLPSHIRRANVTAAMQSIATTETWAKNTTDDLEDGEISAAGIHGFCLKRAYEGGAGRGAEGAFRDYRSIILDLQVMRLADRDAVKFLRSCERDGMKLENCPAYVREWMDRQED
ncbi:MAG TPA: hypothetical protein VNO32_12535, partial [Candidatus Acidoferrum sp.]|nr:hypothetical protein [Candidatus Acidoferrum sp.]